MLMNDIIVQKYLNKIERQFNDYCKQKKKLMRLSKPKLTKSQYQRYYYNIHKETIKKYHKSNMKHHDNIKKSKSNCKSKTPIISFDNVIIIFDLDDENC